MVDNLNPEGGRDRARAPEPVATPASESRVDREVSLGGEGHPALVVQQWLDGEASESAARRASGREVELWSRIAEETERRRRMTTPAPVLDRIMASIPDTRPAAPISWWQRPVSFSNAIALAGGAALLAAGAVVGALLR